MSGAIARRVMSAQTILVTSADRREPAGDDVLDEEFRAHFDDTTLVYDALLDGTVLVLICPSLRNLRRGVDCSTFTDARTGEVLSHSVRTRLRMDEIHIVLAPGTQTVQWDGPLVCAMIDLPHHPRDWFTGRNVLLTMSKNNRLDWIADWMAYYRDCQGADAILLFDNGSTDYTTSQLLDRVAEVDGYRTAVVVDWPRPFGPQGDRFGRGWGSFFLQDGMFELARRGYLPRSRAVLNADIDELVVSTGSATVFDRATTSRHGVVAYHGLWVRSDPCPEQPPTHREADVVEAAPWGPVRRCLPVHGSGPLKWAAVPSRMPPGAQWDTHTVRGVPWSRIPSRHFWYAHYRGITNHWKYRREDDPTAVGSASHTEQLRRALGEVCWPAAVTADRRREPDGRT